LDDDGLIVVVVVVVVVVGYPICPGPPLMGM
jgi:hypothetical protein